MFKLNKNLGGDKMIKFIVALLLVTTLLFSGISNVAADYCETECTWDYVPGYFVECCTTICDYPPGGHTETEICNYYPVHWYWDW